MDTYRSGRRLGPGGIVPSWPPCLAVIGVLMLSSGACAGPPWRGKPPAPPAPEAPDGVAPGTVAVDLSKATDPNPFRRELTSAQRIHTHLDLGKVFERQGNFEAALAEYQQGLAACEKKSFGRNHSTDEALAHRRIAGALDRLGRFAQAELHYKQAIKCSPRDPKIWNDAGYSYYLQGRWADAERTFRTAERLAPDDPRIQTNLGLTLAAAGRPEQALPILSKYSGDAIGHANLGYLLAATGQVELARQQYQKALALRPNLGLAQRALAQLDRAGASPSVASAGLPPLPAPASDPAVRRTSVTATAPRAAATVAPWTSTTTPRLPSRQLPAARPSR